MLFVKCVVSSKCIVIHYPSAYINTYSSFSIFVLRRIDGNVDDTVANVEAAHGELLKYFQSVTSNRWLMIKVFLVLIVFFIVFVVFVA